MKMGTYTRMLSGRPLAAKSAANLRTEAMEERSSSMMSRLAAGVSARKAWRTVSAATRFLAAMTTWAPRAARTRAVSAPIPLDAPGLGWTESDQHVGQEMAEEAGGRARTGDDGGEAGGGEARGDLVGGGGPGEAGGALPAEEPRQHLRPLSGTGRLQRSCCYRVNAHNASVRVGVQRELLPIKKNSKWYFKISKNPKENIVDTCYLQFYIQI